MAQGGVYSALRFPAADDPSVQWRYTQVIDVIKGSPNYTINLGYIQSAVQQWDHDYRVHMSLVQQCQSVGDSGMGFWGENIATNENGGEFNAFCAYWAHTSLSLEIYRIDVYRQS